MPIRRLIVAMTVLGLIMACSSPAWAGDVETPDESRLPVGLSDLLDPIPPPGLTDAGFVRTRDIFDMTFEEPSLYFLGFAFSVFVMDGGPNIDKNDFLSNSYTDSHKKAGVGGLVFLQMRTTPNIYIRADLGGNSFSSNGGITDNLGRKFSIDAFSIIFGSLSGAFYYPLLMLGSEPDKASDLEGLQVYARAGLGFRYFSETKATFTSDPTGGFADGEKITFWHGSGGFTFSMAVGIEFRVDMFCAFLEFGLSTFEGPSPATHPRDFSNGEMILTYPISAGFSMLL